MSQFLLTDNSIKFVNNILRTFAEDHSITHTIVPLYHSQTNPVERVNRVLKDMIIAFLDWNHRNWDIYLKDFRFAYNTVYRTSIGASRILIS